MAIADQDQADTQARTATHDEDIDLLPEGPPEPLPAAPLAYRDLNFIDSPEGRLFRIMAEYSEPMARFRRERIQDTVVFFGSARFRAMHEAHHQMELLANTGSQEPAPAEEQPASGEELAHHQTSDLKRTRAEAAVEMARYYEDARTLARMMATWAKKLPGRRHRFVVTSGGGPGIMEAANRGAWEAGAKTIGLNIVLPFEQVPNRYITPALNFNFHYFFMRKYWFAYLAKALVVFPGGFGTLDEMFELLTLAQTGKLAKKITVVIYGSEYWKQRHQPRPARRKRRHRLEGHGPVPVRRHARRSLPRSHGRSHQEPPRRQKRRRRRSRSERARTLSPGRARPRHSQDPSLNTPADRA